MGVDKFGVGDLNWLAKGGEFDWVRIRHTGELVEARMDGEMVVMKKQKRGVASGQSAVFYKKTGEMVGGGVIK